MSLPEPNIIVERHHIPLSVYMQIYGNSGANITTAPSVTTNMRATPSSTTSIFSTGFLGNTPTTTTRRTTTATTIPETTQSSRQTTTAGRAPNNRVRIEALATGDENDLNLFNALFATLINPTRAAEQSSRQSGLTHEQIADNSTIMTYSANPGPSEDQPSSTICSICTLEYEPRQHIRSLDQCDHCFHISCIDRWLADHNTCPLCRTNVLPEAATNTTNQHRPAATNSTNSRLNDID